MNYQFFYSKLRHINKCPICEKPLNLVKSGTYISPEYYICHMGDYILTRTLDHDIWEESVSINLSSIKTIVVNLEYSNLIFEIVEYGKSSISIPAFDFDWKNFPAMEEKLKTYILFS